MSKKAVGYGIGMLGILLLIGGYFFTGIEDDHYDHEHHHDHAHGNGDTIDDSDWEIPPFRVMSDIDTTLLDQKIQTWVIELLETNNSGIGFSNNIYTSRIREICAGYDDICERMVMVDEFSLKELYTFTLFNTYLISQIDANILLDVQGLRTTLSSIRFLKSNDDITRGKAGHRNVIINTYDMRDIVELFEILTHELFHVLDLGVLVDNTGEKSDVYKEFGKKNFGVDDRSLKFYSISRQDQTNKRNSFNYRNTISEYAQTNTFEEFAEFGNAWINHHVPLLAIAREDPIMLQKYLLFKELFGEWFINKDIETYRTKNLNQRPYDTTRRHDTTDDLEVPRIIQNTRRIN